MSDPDDAWLAKRRAALQFRSEHGWYSDMQQEAAPEHGVTAYKNGCRCDICRAAKTAKHREWRASKRRAADEVAPGINYTTKCAVSDAGDNYEFARG